MSWSWTGFFWSNVIQLNCDLSSKRKGTRIDLKFKSFSSCLKACSICKIRNFGDNNQGELWTRFTHQNKLFESTIINGKSSEVQIFMGLLILLFFTLFIINLRYVNFQNYSSSWNRKEKKIYFYFRHCTTASSFSTPTFCYEHGLKVISNQINLEL